MKGKKCFGLLLALSIIFGLSSSVSSDVNAIDYDEQGSSNITACSMLVGSSNLIGTTNNNGGCIWVPNATGLTSRIVLDLSTPISGKALVVVSGRYSNDFNLGFIGLPGSPTLTPISSNTTINEGQKQLSFQYVFYASAPLSSLRFQGSLWYSNSGQTRVDIDNIQFVLLTSEPTRQQMVALQNSINEINSKTATTNSNLELIRGKLDEIMSNSDRTADAVEQQNQQDQQDRNNMESQQSDSQSGADDSQADAESTGTTLLGAFTGFVGALTSASPSNCNIDMDLGNLDLGVVNLCQLSLPQPFPTIASIMLILFCVPLSIATARKLINLFRSFQG